MSATPALREPGVVQHRTVRWRLWIAALSASLVLLTLTGVGAYRLVEARNDLLAGAQTLQLVRASLQSQSSWRGAAARHRLQARIAEAEARFASARGDLAPLSFLLPHLAWLPRVGTQLAAAPDVADAAYFAASSGLYLVDGLQPVWQAAARPERETHVMTRIAPALARNQRTFRNSEMEAARASRSLRRIPEWSGSDMLDRATAELRAGLPLVRAANSWLIAAPLILGTRFPSTYLVALQDPAELRATGGFIGAAGLISLKGGHPRVTFTGSTLAHEIRSVPPPLPEALYTPEGPWIFRDANWSPDFPLSARLERWFYGQDTGRWVHGVIAIDDPVIADILRATGPVYVPAYHRTVSAENVETLAQHYVNGSAYHGPITGGSADTDRKQFFGWMLKALAARLQSLPLDRWITLARALSGPAATRDIVLYDVRPRVEAAIRQSRFDGSLRPTAGDLLFVVDDNRSYNKLNPYVRETVLHVVSVPPHGRLRETLRIRFHVDPSPTSLEGIGPGFGLQGTKHDYEDFIRIYAPAGARLQSMSGADMWAPQPAYGLTQFAGRLLLREGGSRTVIVRYTVPASVLGNDGRRYLLNVRRQAGTDIRSISVSVHGSGGVAVNASTVRGPVSRILRLNRDVRLAVSLSGVLPPGSPPRPRRTAYPDPYVPFSYLHRDGHGL